MSLQAVNHWGPALAHKAQQLDADFERRLIALPGGGQLSVRERPATGDPALTVVLLHGISSSAASWLDVALALGADVRVLAWDAPGYGASTSLRQSHPRDTDYAASLAAWLRQDVRGPLVLVGHSLGALIAAACAAQAAPPLLLGALLLSPAGGYGASASADREHVRDQRMAALDAFGIEGIAQRIDQRLLSVRANALIREWVRWNAAQLHADGYRQAVHMLCDSDLGRHTEISTPVHVACGDQDIVTSQEACRRWARVWKAPFTPIAGAGHASPAEHPAAVAEWIENSCFSSEAHGRLS